MSPYELQSAIADLVNRPDYQPVKPRIIAKRLGLPKEEVADVRRMVKRMVKLGLVSYASNHIVRPVANDKPSQQSAIEEHEATGQPSPPAPLPEGEGRNERVSDLFRWPEPTRKRKRSEHARPRVIGVFHRTQKGFGFVRPTPTGPEEGERKANDDPKADDIFVPAKYTLDAAGGDVVAVEVKEVKRAHHGDADARLGPRGRVVEIIERQTRRFVGAYFESEGSAYVQIDGKLFTQPVFVGDPARRTLGRTTKWSSRWSASPRPFTMAKA